MKLTTFPKGTTDVFSAHFLESVLRLGLGGFQSLLLLVFLRWFPRHV